MNPMYGLAIGVFRHCCLILLNEDCNATEEHVIAVRAAPHYLLVIPSMQMVIAPMQ